MKPDDFDQQNLEAQLRAIDAQLAQVRRRARITLSVTMLVLAVAVAMIIGLVSR
jgi:hypothetical protein